MGPAGELLLLLTFQERSLSIFTYFSILVQNVHVRTYKFIIPPLKLLDEFLQIVNFFSLII